MPATSPIKFTKVAKGWYATEDGQWAVIKDGYSYVGSQVRDYFGVDDDGWAVCHDPDGGLRQDHQAGENVGWCDTKREAVEYAQP